MDYRINSLIKNYTNIIIINCEISQENKLEYNDYLILTNEKDSILRESQ